MPASPQLTLFLEDGALSVCRLPLDAPWLLPSPGTTIYSVTRTPNELSIVCPMGEEPPGARIEPGWRALQIAGPLAFDLVGVVAAITVPLAEAAVGVFVVSTYDTDLILVKDTDLDLAVSSLKTAGHTVILPTS